MAKQDLLDKIVRDAEERARAILSEAEAKADALTAAANEERATLMDSARKMASAARPEMVRRRESMAELEGRKLVLKEKQTLISESYRVALDQIRKDPRYESLLVNMILSAAEKGDEVIFAAVDFDRVDRKKVIAEANKKSGLALTLSDEKGDFCGGIVLRGKDCDKNLTLDVELDTLRASEDPTANVLFKK
ncbi:MAG: hypothetical protein J5765_02830 [Clostridia bacterium]|nr:hypothetical protein [Clostridia bacterium]